MLNNLIIQLLEYYDALYLTTVLCFVFAVVRTAKPANLQATTWRTNGVGRNVSHSFGYGLMDAAAMVRLARNWRTVPIQHRCEVTAPHTEK